MIPANAIRIGNSFMIDSGNTSPDYFSKLDSEDIEFIEKGSQNYIPIPLTPDIFKKYGFGIETQKFNQIVEKNYYYGFSLVYVKYINKDLNIEVGLKDEGYYLVFISPSFQEEYKIFQMSAYPMQYLHQLENTYYFITGMELINEY